MLPRFFLVSLWIPVKLFFFILSHSLSQVAFASGKIIAYGIVLLVESFRTLSTTSQDGLNVCDFSLAHVCPSGGSCFRTVNLVNPIQEPDGGRSPSTFQ